MASLKFGDHLHQQNCFHTIRKTKISNKLYEILAALQYEMQNIENCN